MVRGVQAQDVMAGDLVRIPPDLTLQDAVDRYFMRYDHSAFPVDEYGRTIGLMTLRKEGDHVAHQGRGEFRVRATCACACYGVCGCPSSLWLARTPWSRLRELMLSLAKILCRW